MLGRLLHFYRSRRRAAAERELVQRLTSELAGYKRIAALVYPVTEYVDDGEAATRVGVLKVALGDRLTAAASADPAWKPVTYAGIPVKSLDEIAADGTDCVVIPSTQFSEVLFHLFNISAARSLPVIAPALAGVPHRLFLRRQLLETIASRRDPNVLEIGSIEHPLGGHRTTQALAETLWGQGTLTTIDINPFTLKLAELYCAGTPTKIDYLAGDCRVVLRNAAHTPLDFVLLHFMSDNSDASAPLIEAFELIESRLGAGSPVVFQSVNRGEAFPGSLHAHLRGKGYATAVTPIPGTSNPSRFFVIARRA
ncbi:MAG: hypothetical protein H0U64_11380 [Gemmatimonadaceae bacterium]|nr:hypothetical protein [Gemmatimonadaceae bacterium]